MTDRNHVRRAYDELSSTYAGERVATDEEAVALESVFDALAPGFRLLDAGCGHGGPVLERALDPSIGDEDESEQKPGLAVGLDFSRSQLETAAEFVPDAALCQGELTTLPFVANSFDAVTALYSVIHVPADDHPTVIDEFARVLRPGGRLLLTEGHTEWTGANPDWLATGTEMQWSMAGAAATRNHLESAGFEIVADGTFQDELAEDDDVRFPYFHARLAA
ncbi:class I SAM-dependent methyltransferase [Natrinema salifodinae]|nr:class I SAM-dependent methyltransferase [Natrinema salifodinae]